MTTTSERRYRTPSTAYGPGRDLLLDREVTIARFPSENAARIARGLRATPTSNWLEVFDAYAEEGDVVVVMPPTGGSLAQDLAAGMPAHRAAELDDDLLNALTHLRALGLAPVSLDADQIGMTPTGHPLLLPAPGPRELTVEHATLLASLGGSPGASATTVVLDDQTDTGARTSEIPPPAAVAQPAIEVPTRPSPSTAVRYPRAGLTAAETGRKDPTGRRRALALAVGAAAAVLAVGVLMTSQTDRPTGPAAEGAVSGQAAAAAVQPDPLQSALSDLQADPAAAGAGGAALAERLRATQIATGPEQSFQAAAVLETISAGRADGILDGPLVIGVEQAVAPLARPRDLAALITLVAVDPVAFGPRTVKFAGRLDALETRLTGEAARTEAQDLLAIVQAGPAKGEFTATFALLASPVLADLAIPADLAGLVAAAKVEPARFGPRVPKFSGRLVKLQTLTGEAAQVEAADLVQIVSVGVAKGEFTASFRDIALPVLRPLAAP